MSGCACEPSGADGLVCPDPTTGRLLCDDDPGVPAGQVPRDAAFWATFEAVLAERASAERATPTRLTRPELDARLAAEAEVRKAHVSHYCTAPGHCPEDGGRAKTPTCAQCGPGTVAWPCAPRLALQQPFGHGSNGPNRQLGDMFHLVDGGRMWVAGDSDPGAPRNVWGLGALDRYGFVWINDIMAGSGQRGWRCSLLQRNRAWVDLVAERGPLRELAPPPDGICNIARGQRMRERGLVWSAGEQVPAASVGSIS